jgi:hypothetical protein
MKPITRIEMYSVTSNTPRETMAGESCAALVSWRMRGRKRGRRRVRAQFRKRRVG